MKRIVKIPNAYGREDKYILQKEYEGFGIYQEKTPSGFFKHQSYLITNEKIIVVCQSYNDMCVEELMDVIDNYNKNGKFGIKVMNVNGIYFMHPNGNVRV